MGFNHISEITGISFDRLNELSSLSDLVRLYGVGLAFSRIIHDAGIDSVKDFIKYTGEEIIKIYESKTKNKADFSKNDIDFSIELAKALIKC